MKRRANLTNKLHFNLFPPQFICLSGLKHGFAAAFVFISRKKEDIVNSGSEKTG
jgi:hypothetical protein